MKPRSFVIAVATIFFALHASLASAQQQSPDEQAVWKLEQAYWNYVKALDLDSYRNLWHPNFLGWPLSSSKPVKKDHITDWISLYTAKGLRLKSFTLTPAASQAVENLIITHYWLTSLWADNLGHGEPQTLRITHTWIRTSGGWQIVAGMSAPGAPAP
ncbi:MAG TPA: nuclear transport factor 2 family protein [Terriglobales bacterium]|nr:nuclear transport factor 2 family protein [Terriglobales bacterium]